MKLIYLTCSLLFSALLSGCYIKGSISELEEALTADKTTSSTSTTIPSTTTTTLPPLQINAVTLLSGDIANNSLTTTPNFSFNYSTLGNTYNFGNFEFSIGSSVGATNILNWTSIGSSQVINQSGLSLIQDTDYYVNVRAKDTMGNVSTSVSASWRAVASVSVAARFAAAPNWMDYVKISNTAQACDNTANGYYNCYHGGEKKTVTATGENSCAGLTAYDALGVFTWTCVAGTPVTFITKEVKPGKGLKDLVTSSGWINNRVFIIKNGSPLKSSTYSAWWTNPVTALPSNSTGPAPVSLSSTGTIYVVNSDIISYGYQITVDKIGIVVKAGYTLSIDPNASMNCQNGTNRCLFLGSNTIVIGNYSWFEGNFKGNSNEIFWNSFLTYGLVFNNSQFYNWGYIAFGNYNSFLLRGNLITKTTGGMSFYADNSNHSSYRENKFLNTHIELTDLSNYNVMSNNVIYSSSGFQLPGTNDNIVSFNTISSESGNYFLGAGSQKNTVHNLLFYGDMSLYFIGGSRLTFSHVVGNKMTIYGSSATNIKFTGLTGFNSCETFGGILKPNDGLNATCGLIAPSNGTAVTVANVNASQYGRISSDTHFPGYEIASGLPFSTINVQTQFDSFFTGLVNGFITNCSSGDTCYLFSSKLKSNDSVILNKSGNLTAANSAFPNIATDPCPAEVHGNNTATDQATTPHTYLLNAMEIIGDEIGNDNGLCESNEACIYAPNIGAYQGEGDYTTKTCAFQNGTVTGVQLYAYPTNGQ